MPRPPPSPSPPASTFSFMSGNFDFPHASTSPPPPPRGYHEQFREHVIRRQQEQAARENAASDREDSVIPPRRPRIEPPRRRPLRRTLLGERESRDANSLLRRPPPQPTTARPRATPSERYLRRSHARARDQRTNNGMDSPDPLDSLSDGSNLFALANSNTRPRSPAGELDGSRRHSKRRKLDHDANSPPGYDSFKYGHHGQVVPGRLKMEVVSCDGGEYKKSNSDGLYKIQNVLKNDKSVYCSESSRCNLLLKHMGEMHFALEKVVIRTPDRGFTAPVQEGLIFVSMSSDELVSQTSDWKIEYDSPLPRRSATPNPSGDQQISLQEAVDDPYIWENSRQGRQEAAEEALERLELQNRRRWRRNYDEAMRERHQGERRSAETQEDPFIEHCDYPADDSFATAAGISAPTPPPFTITTESGEESEEQEEVPSAAIMADRLRRESRWRSDSGDDDDDDDDELLYRFPPPRRAFALDSMENFSGRWRRDRRDIEPIRATRLHAPSRIERKDSASDSDGLGTVPARFFIARNKNKITIRFHPAVSGKFILLKLWSPTHNGNIDIEHVQFHGYSGPRYFPAQQLR
ncbi:uncharacterized protein BDR25DRAFT_255746 [Lindgomyces ingoldianus]|uniref:Uncharacterized protein n=1 Tax=Lindgomyces ingoldianus TaxID=673940 RepID=A0ACB6R5J3_9PLEO|nr:uncharacterized protein BDR25DRAFT_255746 [Lindgomyces ingoldianus]KAF2474113.1 hypothetical protein BDR25DRAFT_255746 [Lindgomyces ingoldianus]